MLYLCQSDSFFGRRTAKKCQNLTNIHTIVRVANKKEGFLAGIIGSTKKRQQDLLE